MNANRGVLVVGYGNSLRGDDGLGWHAALRLAADPRLAGALYGTAPPVFLVTAAVATCEVGERLSPALERALPRVVDAVAGIVVEHSHA